MQLLIVYKKVCRGFIMNPSTMSQVNKNILLEFSKSFSNGIQFNNIASLDQIVCETFEIDCINFLLHNNQSQNILIAGNKPCL
jgi:hypothetical protein